MATPAAQLNKFQSIHQESDSKRMLPIRVFVILGFIGSMWYATQYFAHTFAYHEALGENIRHIYAPWKIVQWWIQYHVTYQHEVLEAQMHGVGASVFVLAIGMMAALYVWTRPSVTEGLHGTARWADYHDMREAGLLPRHELRAFDVVWNELQPPVRMAAALAAALVMEVALGVFLPKAGIPPLAMLPVMLGLVASMYWWYMHEEKRLAVGGGEHKGVVVGGVEMNRWKVRRLNFLGVRFPWPVRKTEVVMLRHDGKEHVLTFAPTRSGKGVALILPTLLTWKESVIATDIKGELWELTSGWRRQAGNVCMRFEPSCPSVTYPDGTRSTARWNPLDEVRIRPQFTRAVVGNSRCEKGGHWQDDQGQLEIARDRDGFVQWDDDKGVGDAQNLAMLIVDPLGKGLDDHWAKTAHAITVGLILHVIYMWQAGLSDDRPSLRLVDQIISDPNRRLKDLWADMILGGSDPKKGVKGYYHNAVQVVDPREKEEADAAKKNAAKTGRPAPPTAITQHAGSGHPSVMSAAQDMVDRPENEAGSVLSTAKSNLALYRDPIVGENTSYSDFSILDLMYHEKPVSLYLVLPPSDKDRMMPLVRILLNATMRNLVEMRPALRPDDGDVLPPGRTKKHRLLGMLDEFPSVGKLPIIQEGLAYVAGYGIKLYLITQDLAQIQEKYGKEESITSNCHVQNAYNPLRMETAEYLSKRCGESTVIQDKRSASGTFGTGSGRSTSDAVNEVKRPLITPDEVMTMPGALKDSKGYIQKPGKMLVMIAGVPVVYGTQSFFKLFPQIDAAYMIPGIKIKAVPGLTVSQSLWSDHEGAYWKATEVVIPNVISDTEKRLVGRHGENSRIDEEVVRAAARGDDIEPQQPEIPDEPRPGRIAGLRSRMEAQRGLRAGGAVQRRQGRALEESVEPATPPAPSSGELGSGDAFDLKKWEANEIAKVNAHARQMEESQPAPLVTDADASGQAGEPANSGESTESPAGVGGETAQADGGETSSNSGETASDAGAPPAESPDGDEGGGPENVRKIVLRVATSGAEADDDDRVIEVAAVEIVGGKLTGNVFHRQVDPATPIDEAATARHGLTNESVDGAPSFVSMAADLAAFLEDAELVFWDWQREMGALEGEFDRVEMEIDRESGADVPELRPPSDHELVDLKDLAHELHPNGPSDLPGLFEMHDVQAQPLAEGQRPNALLEARGIASLYLALVAAGASRDREQEQEEPQESRPEPSSAV